MTDFLLCILLSGKQDQGWYDGDWEKCLDQMYQIEQ